MEDTSTEPDPEPRSDREPAESDDDGSPRDDDGAPGGDASPPSDPSRGSDGDGPVGASDRPDDASERPNDAPDGPDDAPDGPDDADDLAALRERVDEEYDFDDFGPSDMARMSAEEWDAAFDPDSWITGDRLLARAEAELQSRIARRDVFGVLERVREDGEERLLVYSDEGYAIVRPTGEVTGQGTVLRDIEPVVALAAMESHDVPEPPDDWSLPHPDTVPEGSGEFGNLMVQVIAVVQVLAGAALLVASFVADLNTIVAPAMGIVFLLIGLLLFVMVANARLSDRFRSEEYRERLRALRQAKERPDFVPVEGGVVNEDGRDE